MRLQYNSKQEESKTRLKIVLEKCKICGQRVPKPCKDWDERWKLCNLRLLSKDENSNS